MVLVVIYIYINTLRYMYASTPLGRLTLCLSDEVDSIALCGTSWPLKDGSYVHGDREASALPGSTACTSSHALM